MSMAPIEKSFWEILEHLLFKIESINSFNLTDCYSLINVVRCLKWICIMIEEPKAPLLSESSIVAINRRYNRLTKTVRFETLFIQDDYVCESR